MENMVEVNDYKRKNFFVAEEKFVSDKEAREYIKMAQEGDDNAMERIIMKNIPMLSYYAKIYSRRGSNFDDLYSEGNIAIIKAVENFDVNGIVSVGTALMTAVKTAMRRFAGIDRNLRIAVNANENKSKIHAVIARMQAEGKEPMLDEVAKECNMKRAKVEKLIAVDLGVASMNVKVEGKDNEGDEMGDSIIADVKDPYEELEHNEQFSIMEKLVNRLKGMEKLVIEFRYGLNDKEEKTYKEIAVEYGRTAEGIRQIEMRAIRRMQEMITA